MGVDLTLCPDKYGEESSDAAKWFLAHTRIDLHRDYALQGAIRKIGAHPLPVDVRFDWYGDEGIEHKTTDAYGSPLTFLRAAQFSKIPFRVLKDASVWNQAAIRFMRSLAPQTRVVLWWY